MDLRKGHIYRRLAEVLWKSHYLTPHTASAITAVSATQLLSDFFASPHVRATLGDANCLRVRGSKGPSDHLRVLAYIRVVLEVDMPDKYVAFFRGSGLSSSRLPPENTDEALRPAAALMFGAPDVASARSMRARSRSPSGCSHRQSSATCNQCKALELNEHDVSCRKCALRFAIAESGALGVSKVDEQLFHKGSGLKAVADATTHWLATRG